MRTKHIATILLLCSQLLLSCGYQPRENIPQPKPDIPIYPCDSGTLIQGTDGTKQASTPLLADECTHKTQPNTNRSATIPANPDRNLSIDFRHMLLTAPDEVQRTICEFYGPLDWFVLCTTQLLLLSQRWYHQLLASHLQTTSLSFQMQCLIDPQIQAWRKLEVQILLPDIPPITPQILKEIYRLHKRNEQPVLLLDLGISIDALQERYIAYTNAIELAAIYENHNRQITIHEEVMHTTRNSPQWILLPAVDYGILPGSRNKKYQQQVLYMYMNYADYVVGDAREMVTVAMLSYLCGKQMFPNAPEETKGRCKTKLENGKSHLPNQRFVLAGNPELPNSWGGGGVLLSCCQS